MKEESLLNFIDGISHKVHFKSSEKMKEVKKESVQCVVTSPPYWDLKTITLMGRLGIKKHTKSIILGLKQSGKSAIVCSKRMAQFG